MAREIPEAVRAAAGLAATVLDETRKLPETLPGLPVRAVGLAMQATMKLQQHYAGLVARGDEVFTGVLGDREPGLATFDDEIGNAPPAAATPPGFRDSPFDRAAAPADDHPDTDTDTDTDLDTHDALEELAIEDLVDAEPASPEADTEGPANALLQADGAGADGAAQASLLEAPAEPPVAEPAPVAPAVTETSGGDRSPTEVGGTAPVDGYDDFSIAQLRGRLRGYAPTTVESLLAYEEATRARAPYLRMLRNRLERLDAQAVEASPLAPRGA